MSVLLEYRLMEADVALRDGSAAQGLGIPYVLVGGQRDGCMFASVPDFLSLECFRIAMSGRLEVELTLAHR